MVAWSGWIGRLWILWLLVRSAWWRRGLPWFNEKAGWGGGNGLYMRELNMCVRRLNIHGGLINRVLETRFPGGHHVEKIPHQT